MRELSTLADPARFEHNDLSPVGGPTALYLDEAARPLVTVSAVNALGDTIVAGTFSADPLFVSYPSDLHLLPGSLCDGTGTPVGAPAGDFDGVARSSTAPDVGAFERP